MESCNKDCFSCIYEDCIYDDIDYEDYKLGDRLDRAVLKEQNISTRGLLSEEDRKIRRRASWRAYQKRIKEQERSKHTNVHECGNENVLEYWKEWRRRKLNE